jgi:hypothetical protein
MSINREYNLKKQIVSKMREEMTTILFPSATHPSSESIFKLMDELDEFDLHNSMKYMILSEKIIWQIETFQSYDNVSDKDLVLLFLSFDRLRAFHDIATYQDKLITCLVSIMSGCQAICHINTRIRPDRALAQCWGLECFAEQSTVADTLNQFTRCHVSQLRQAVNTIYLREGRAVQHDYTKQGLLILDVDLTGLPASKHAEGSRKGYFSGKKGGVDANSPVSAPLSIMKICSVSCILVIRRRKRVYLRRSNSLKPCCSSMNVTNAVMS